MKINSSLIAFLLLFSGANLAHAATPITGEVHGSVFQHMSMNHAGLYGVDIDDVGNSGENCDETAQTCRINGFSWSDVVGWTYWDGDGLQSELGGAASFPDEYMAKVTYNGNLSGFIWGEKFGWIQLSACAGLNTQAACNAKSYCVWSGSYCEAGNGGLIPETTSQTMNDWGVYLDLCPLKSTQTDCESATNDPYCNWGHCRKPVCF